MLKKILVGLIVVVALLAGSSYLLPDTYHVERSVVVPADPAAVFDTLGDLETWPEWTTWSPESDPSCEWTFSGAKAAPGHRMVWLGDVHGQGEIELTSADPGKTIRYDMAFDEGSFRSSGGFDLRAVDGGTEVSWFFGGEAGSNPIGRWMSQFIGLLVGPDFEQGLANLAARHGAAAGADSTSG